MSATKNPLGPAIRSLADRLKLCLGDDAMDGSRPGDRDVRLAGAGSY